MRYDFWKGPRRNPYVAGTLDLFTRKITNWARQDAFHYRPSAGTWADDVARERATTEAIQTDPWKHLPPEARLYPAGKDWLNMGQGRCWL